MVLWGAVYCALLTSLWGVVPFDSVAFQHLQRLADILAVLCIGIGAVVLVGAL